MKISIKELEDGWTVVYEANGNSCTHQFRSLQEVTKDIGNLKQIEINLFKCPNPAPDRLLKN